MLLVGSVAMLLGLAGLTLSTISQSARTAPWTKRLLLCGVVAAPVQITGYLILGRWMAAAISALMGVLMFMRWETRRDADGQRTWVQPRLQRWLDRTVIRRLPISRRQIDRLQTASGNQGLTLTDLRAEYAQPILDDATRDPQLDALLESISAELLTLVLEIESNLDRTDPRPRLITRYIVLSEIAYRVLAESTEPGATIGPSPYRGYSRPMLTVAAACRLGSSTELKPA